MLAWARDIKRSWWPAEPCTRARAELSWLSLGYVPPRRPTDPPHRITGRADNIVDIYNFDDNDIETLDNESNNTPEKTTINVRALAPNLDSSDVYRRSNNRVNNNTDIGGQVETHKTVDNPCFGSGEVVITSETRSEYVM